MTALLDGYAVLEDLGGSVEDVADTLRSGGYKGPRVDVCNCPVARYLLDGLRKRGRRPRYVEVNGIEFMVGHGNRMLLPPPVHAFIWHFDSGAFPELEENDA